jgi:hypothetical protein
MRESRSKQIRLWEAQFRENLKGGTDKTDKSPAVVTGLEDEEAKRCYFFV